MQIETEEFCLCKEFMETWKCKDSKIKLLLPEIRKLIDKAYYEWLSDWYNWATQDISERFNLR